VAIVCGASHSPLLPLYDLVLSHRHSLPYLELIICSHSPVVKEKLIYTLSFLLFEPCSSIIGRGTMQQAGRSRVRFRMGSLDFSIDLILPAALWPWGQLSL
jgi:hypothetical protein